MNTRPRALSHFISVFGCAIALRAAGGQRSPTWPAIAPTGCWQLKPGPFSVIRRLPADPGQTILPLLISLDTMPGRSWDNRPIGRRVRTLTDTTATQYHEGYYRVVGPDSVLVDWSDSVVGMTLALQFDSLTMRGLATAWTDYGGGQHASITLRRVTCPTAR